MTTFSCPSCGQTIGAEVPAGSSVTCPLCSHIVTVPASGAPIAQAAPPTESTWPVVPQPAQYQNMAITSMVLGILSVVTGCFALLGIVALILGIIAVRRANRRPTEYGGKGFAITGICTSLASLVFMLLLVPMFLAILLPSMSKARELARRSVCAANLGGTGKALAIYAAQYNDVYPSDMDILVTSSLARPSQFLCPSAVPDAADTSTYNMGQPLPAAIRSQIHSCYIYIPGHTADSDPKDVILYEKASNHVEDGGNVLFADLHVQWIEPYSKIEELVARTKAHLAPASQPAEMEPAAAPQ